MGVSDDSTKCLVVARAVRKMEEKEGKGVPISGSDQDRLYSFQVVIGLDAEIIGVRHHPHPLIGVPALEC